MFATFARIRKAMSAAVSIAAVPLLVVSCNQAGTFADQFSAYLKEQPDVATFSVRPNNAVLSAGSVDTSVTLRTGLSDDQSSAAIRAIAAHRVDEDVSEHRIRVTVPSVNQRRTPVDVTLIVVPGSHEPRTGDASTVRHWVQRAREFAAADSELSSLGFWTDSVQGETTGSAYPLAERLDAFVAAEPAGLTRLSVIGGDCSLQWDAGDPLAALEPYRELIALLPDGVRPAHCLVSSQRPLTEPNIDLTLPRGTDSATRKAIAARAAELGLAARITVAA